MNFRFMNTLCCVAILLAPFSAYAAECENPETSLEISLCLGKELRDSDVKINQSYKELMGKLGESDKTTLRTQQRTWIKERDSVCGLDTDASNREEWLRELLLDYGRTVCVTRYTRKRTAEFDLMLKKASGQPGESTVLQLPGSNPMDDMGVGYDKISATPHSNGKWYFELLINYREVVQTGPILVITGVSDKGHLTGTMDNIRVQDAGKYSVTIGVAADLDNGKLYISRNGVWFGGVPGSNEGIDVTQGRNYYGTFAISADSPKPYIDNKALIPNFGDQQMMYAPPAGYHAWRSIAAKVDTTTNRIPELAKRLNCTACHSGNTRVVGPAWVDVSNKYKNASQFEYQGRMYPLEEGLTLKISKGGAGHWGNMPMPANDPNGVKQDAIKMIVRSVLNLAK